MAEFPRTKKERDRAFKKARTEVLRRKTRIQKDTREEILRLLTVAQSRVAAVLAGTPSEFQAFMLPQLQEAVRQAMADLGKEAASVLDTNMVAAWQAGLDLVDQPLAAGGLRIAAVLPAIDIKQLEGMRAFTTDRAKDIGAQLANKINQELGLVAIGAQTTGDAIGKIEGLIRKGGRSRATTILRTELGRAFAVATNERLQQAKDILPGLKKQWRRSGKLHSRPSHDAADGQIQEVDEPFIVGGVRLMHPRDPKAPPGETINCGCEELPYMESWDVANPGRKSFTQAELAASQFRRDLQSSVPLSDIVRS